MKSGLDGICCVCKAPTKFKSIIDGYRKFCSTACVSRGSVETIANTKKTRYGNSHYVNPQKAKTTCLDKYGVEHPSQLDSVKDKIKQTNVLRYGYECAAKSDIAKKHYKDTCRRKYGVDSHNQLESVKQLKEVTYINRYGVSNPNQSDDIIAKRIQTRIQRYGSYLNDDILRKMQATCMDKYGVAHALQYPAFLEKYKQTCLAKYGVETNLQLTHEMALYKYNDVLFDSSWEVAYYIWLMDNQIQFSYHPSPIKYEIDGKIHFYFPDFIVNGEYVELKGPHLINSMHELINPITKQVLYEKTQCLRDHNVKLITDCKEYLQYVKRKYGTNFIQQCKLTTHKFI